MKIDQDGKVLKAAVQLPDGARITRGDEPFLWGGKAAFLAGDVTRNATQIHALDGELNYKVLTAPVN